MDKGPKNIGIICKYFYLQMLNDEIVKSGIVSKYSSILKEKHNVSFKQSYLPFIYWIPKFHKYPVDFRFITSGKNTVINTLSKFIGICLKHLLDVGHHCKLVHKFDGIKDYYIIDNNKEVIQFMKESNRLNNHDKNIQTYDFKTLYTKIPLNKLKRNIQTFISTLFEYKKRKYINISSESAQFSDKVSTHGSFTELEIIHQIDFTIDNCFISYNHLVFKQTIGIPTATNCASHLANIFLHIYEKTFIHTWSQTPWY